MTDNPNVRFINLVDKPASLLYNKGGQVQVALESAAGQATDVTGFRRVSIRVGATKATSCDLYMGKIAGTTLAQKFSVPLDGQIHTFDVVGPEITLWLGGAPANSKESVQLWVYLRS